MWLTGSGIAWVIVISVLVGASCAVIFMHLSSIEETRKENVQKPRKLRTPELIHHRIVKAQWRLLKIRMNNLLTQRKEETGFTCGTSSIRFERTCRGAIYLGEKQVEYRHDDIPVQLIPLCQENRERLERLGFKRFSEDGYWVFYVEPLQELNK